MGGDLATAALLHCFLILFMKILIVTSVLKVNRREFGDIVQVSDEETCRMFKNTNWNETVDSLCYCSYTGNTFHLVDDMFGCYNKTEVFEECTQPVDGNQLLHDTTLTTLVYLFGSYKCSVQFTSWNGDGGWYTEPYIEIIHITNITHTIIQVRSTNVNKTKGKIFKIQGVCKNIFNIQREVCISLKAEGLFKYNYTTPRPTSLPITTSVKIDLSSTSELSSTPELSSTSVPTTHLSTTTRYNTTTMLSTDIVVLTKTDPMLSTHDKTRTRLNVLVIAPSCIFAVYLVVIIILYAVYKRTRDYAEKKSDAPPEEINDSHSDKSHVYITLPSDGTTIAQQNVQDVATTSEDRYTSLDFRNCPENEYRELEHRQNFVNNNQENIMKQRQQPQAQQQQQNQQQRPLQNQQQRPQLQPQPKQKLQQQPVYSMADGKNLSAKREPIYSIIEPLSLSTDENEKLGTKEEPFYFQTEPYTRNKENRFATL